jgi:hypothetical protein
MCDAIHRSDISGVSICQSTITGEKSDMFAWQHCTLRGVILAVSLSENLSNDFAS